VAGVHAIAALDEPTRRQLYELVARSPLPVGKDEAAAALGIPRTTAAFHLDKLVGEGLLSVVYERRCGRTGPGAGRPAKLYRRSDLQVEISLPERTYDVAARLLAAALQEAETTGESPKEALARQAIHHGRSLGRTARAKHIAGEHEADPASTTSPANPTQGEDQAEPTRDGETAKPTRDEDTAEPTRDTAQPTRDEGTAGATREGWALVVGVLAGQGFEPRAEGAEILLGNCPFHGLAKEYPALVCGMNQQLLAGVLDGVGDDEREAVISPSPGHCCVRVKRRAE
jgi:predicted ArsR family transcriptional regulator